MLASRCQNCALYRTDGRLCACLRPGELRRLSECSSPVELARNSLLRAENPAHWPVTAVTEGTVGVQHILDDGRRSIAAFYTSGDIIDLHKPGMDLRYSIVALARSRLCRFGAAALDDVLESNVPAQQVMLDNLRQQTCRALDHCVDLGKRKALERVASFILECRNRQPAAASGPAEIKLPMRQCDVADYLGLQAETVSRSLRELQSCKIIDQPASNRIMIKNAPMLRRLANGTRSKRTRA